jgi:hypothetical protein
MLFFILYSNTIIKKATKSIFGNLVLDVKKNVLLKKKSKFVTFVLKVSNNPGLRIISANSEDHYFMFKCYFQNYRLIRNILDDIYVSPHEKFKKLEEDCKKIFGIFYKKMSRLPKVVINSNEITETVLLNVFLELVFWHGFQEIIF